jgi:hypothetical protein
MWTTLSHQRRTRRHAYVHHGNQDSHTEPAARYYGLRHRVRCHSATGVAGHSYRLQIGQPVVYGGCAFDLNGDGEFDWAVHDTDADGFYDASSADLDFNGKPETFFTIIGSPDGTPYARYDHDTDGLYDDEELNVFGTNPYVWDTDGDGYSDGHEDFSGSSPMDPYCNPYGCG